MIVNLRHSTRHLDHTVFMKHVFLAMLAAGSLAGHAIGGTMSLTIRSDSTVEMEASPFRKGGTELDVNGGYFWGVDQEGTRLVPDTEFALGSLRYGWMLNDPSGGGLLRGNWEVMIAAFGGPITKGPGDCIIGGDLILRYNFVQPQANVVPYLQINGGGAYSDAADDDPVQDLLGSDWSFALGASFGLRWMVNERWAVTTAFEWRHFSNAGSNERNRGYNGLGGTIGVAFFY